MIHIIGGGLAGCEAGWQAAERGVDVTIHEMRPVRKTAVHQTGQLAELVCSNSFRGDKLDNAVGLLKEEMRRLGSLVMRAADATRVPAGAALAVDRHAFARAVGDAVLTHPRITVTREEVPAVPGAGRGWSPVIIATGPLTSDALSADIRAMVGEDHLSFYDAISPIVLAESIDMTKVFRASRWDRSLVDGERRAGRHARGIRRAHDQRAEPPHFLLEQSDSVVDLVTAKRVAADELGQLVGLMHGRLPHRPHLVDGHIDTDSTARPFGSDALVVPSVT